MQADKELIIGKISGAYGLKGWVKVVAFTEYLDSLLDYSPWILKKNGTRLSLKVINGRIHGTTLVAQLEGINDRDAAESLKGSEIYITYAQLPEAEAGEYYWIDLIGLTVKNLTGEELGLVDSLMETGANDVMLVKGQKTHAVPFIQGQVIINIDLAQKLILVDWDTDF